MSLRLNTISGSNGDAGMEETSQCHQDDNESASVGKTFNDSITEEMRMGQKARGWHCLRWGTVHDWWRARVSGLRNKRLEEESAGREAVHGVRSVGLRLQEFAFQMRGDICLI